MAKENSEGSPFSVSSPSKALLERLKGSIWKYPITILIPNLVFLFMASVDVCLGLLAVVLLVTLFLWLLKIEKILHQVMIGAVTLIVTSMVLSGFVLSILNEPTIGASSDDGQTLIDGTVTPFRAAIGSSSEYTLTVKVPKGYANVSNIVAYVNISEDMISWNKNITMALESDNISGNYHLWNYSVSTAVTGMVASYYFVAEVNGTWHHTEVMNGPISGDSLAIFFFMFSTYLPTIFAFGFMQLIVMILFLRFSSKSKQAREKMKQEYKKRKEELRSVKQASKGGSGKVLPAGSEETFVCSECGADVQASAKFCPQCGESFEEDEEGAESKEGK